MSIILDIYISIFGTVFNCTDNLFTVYREYRVMFAVRHIIIIINVFELKGDM